MKADRTRWRGAAILAKNRLACHGPDRNARKADHRLDREAAAWADVGNVLLNLDETITRG